MAQAVPLVVPQIGEFATIRNHFAKQDNLTSEQAARFYSDSKLSAAAQADPSTFAQWQHEASLCV